MSGLTILKVWACHWGPFYGIPENAAHTILENELRERCRREKGEAGSMGVEDARNLLAAEQALRRAHDNVNP